MTQPPQGPPPITAAMQWVSRIMTVALVMILPGLAGHWLDQRWKTTVFTPLGFGFGLVAGLYHLLVMTGVIKKRHKRKQKNDKNEP